MIENVILNPFLSLHTPAHTHTHTRTQWGVHIIAHVHQGRQDPDHRRRSDSHRGGVRFPFQQHRFRFRLARQGCLYVEARQGYVDCHREVCILTGRPVSSQASLRRSRATSCSWCPEPRPPSPYPLQGLAGSDRICHRSSVQRSKQSTDERISEVVQLASVEEKEVAASLVESRDRLSRADGSVACIGSNHGGCRRCHCSPQELHQHPD